MFFSSSSQIHLFDSTSLQSHARTRTLNGNSGPKISQGFSGKEDSKVHWTRILALKVYLTCLLLCIIRFKAFDVIFAALRRGCAKKLIFVELARSYSQDIAIGTDYAA